MKKVFIKYNPYKLETEIKVDGNELKQNSILVEKSANGSRLQEWVEVLPYILKEEYNDTEFDVTFHGTLLDYEDLAAAFSDARETDKIIGDIPKRVPAKETSDKEVLIDEVFSEIQRGPFAELHAEEITSAFELARSSDFELCVVATMSAGKSTLINAMLGTKLMPSKQEACTAIITRIKDVTDNDEAPFEAEVYDKDGVLSESQKNLTYPIMEHLNSNENVSEIRVSGNIPFVTSEDVSLVLIDTPGPNNSRDPRHRKVQSRLLGKSSKALVLYIMTGEFGTDDDNTLLKRVAESMAVGGKQSKDRFIFVVNKLDNRTKDDGDTQQTLDKVRLYLKSHGITDPNLFPVAALPALWIRQYLNGELTDEKDEDEVLEMEMKIKKFNRNSNGGMHFEDYASLPPSIRGEINRRLEANKEEWKGNPNENPEEALIHTGIVSIEAAIRQYVQKYAKTAKIKNIVDTFTHKLDEVGCFEQTKRELAANYDQRELILAKIFSIVQKVDDVNNAMKFKDAVHDAVVKVSDDSKELIDVTERKLQVEITRYMDDLRGLELEVDDAEEVVELLKQRAKGLEADFEVELDDCIRNNLINTSDALLEEYKRKLASLTEEINIHEISGANIDPLKLMGGSVGTLKFTMEKFIREKEVEDGEEWIKNTDKKWYKPWTWLQESGYYRNLYKTVKYVHGYILAQEFFRPIKRNLQDNIDAVGKYAFEQSRRIEDDFTAKFNELDDILKSKLSELESYATDRNKAEERIKESERKLAWLEGIRSKVESILEI